MYFGYLMGAETHYGGGVWRPCWSARSVEAVEAHDYYKFEPEADLRGAMLERKNLKRANLSCAHGDPSLVEQ